MGAEGIRKRGQAANPSETATPQDSADAAAAAAPVDAKKSQKGKDRQRRCRWCFVLAVWFGGLCAVLAVAWLFCQSIVRVAAAAVRNLCCGRPVDAEYAGRRRQVVRRNKRVQVCQSPAGYHVALTDSDSHESRWMAPGPSARDAGGRSSR